MALARIITGNPDRLTTLAEYLRFRGYTVEVVTPGASPTTTAELELDLEGVSSDEALDRARQAADAAQNQGRRAIAYDITGRPVAFAEEEEEEPPAKGSNAVAQAWNGLRSAGHDMVENLRLSLGRFGEWIAEGRRSVQEQRARVQQGHRKAAEEKRRQREAEILAREAERSRQQQEEAARAREQVAAQARRLEEQQLRRREEEAERERRLLERFQREARRDVLQEKFELEQQQATETIAPAEATLARRYVPAAPLPPSRRDGDWTKAMVAAIALALLITLGFAAYAHRHPASPVSNRALVRSDSVKESVPFGAATVAPPQSSRANPPSRDARPVAPSNKLPQSDVAPPPAPAPARTARPKKPHRTSRLADDTIAEDEVVVYHSHSSAPHTASSSAGPKHISDLEQ